MAFDFWEGDAPDMEAFDEQGEAEIVCRWMAGWHQAGNGRKIRIKDMEDSHLDRTIRYFKSRYFDVSVLEREVARREKLEDKNLGL